MIALTASTPPALNTALTALSANSSPVFCMRSSSVSVHLELPFAPAMRKACQTLRGLPVGQVVISRNTSSRLRVLPDRRQSYVPHIITGPHRVEAIRNDGFKTVHRGNAGCHHRHPTDRK